MNILPINHIVIERGEPSEPQISKLMENVIEQKRIHLQQKIDTRFKGANLLKEVVYVTSDVGTAGFSMVQGVSLLTKVSQGLKLAGSICGLVGGLLNIGQGLFFLTEAVQSLKNGQRQQASRLFADALLLIGIGLLMLLASLSILGVQLGCIAGAAAIAANPYAMPILILLLVLPGLIQTLSHLSAVARRKDLGSELKLDQMDPSEEIQNLHLEKLKSLKGPEALEEISKMMENFSEKVGVEAGIEVLDLLKMILERREAEEIQEKIELSKKKIAEWNRMVCLRAFQLSLYALTAPLGLSAACLSTSVSRIICAASKLFLTAPSSIGAYMDSCEPFKRNGAISVPKVDTPLSQVI